MTLLLLACTADKGPPGSETAADSVPTETADDSDSTPVTTDADGDGFAPPEDCDDTDDDVHPGATEVIGNTTDEDCDGLAVADDDEDGHAPIAEGGDDCDDTSAWVYPGAVEYCDPVDQDCDGEPLVEGGCGGFQDPRAASWQVFVGSNGDSVADFTGDGRVELRSGGGASYYEIEGTWYSPVWAYYDASALLAAPHTPPRGAAQVVTAADSGRAQYTIEAGDVTGDGYPDFAIFGVFVYTAYILPGPLPLDGTVLDAGGSGFEWNGYARHPDTWCDSLVLGGDFDADGLTDALCGASDIDVADGTLQLFRGGEFGYAYTDVTYDGETNVTVDQLLPDLTGDGANEVVVYDNPDNVALIVDGLALAMGGEVTESALASMEVINLSLVYAASDRTGDGVPELLVGTQADFLGYEHGAAYLMDGTARGTLAPEAALGCWVGTPELEVGGGWGLDLDGDGEEETLINAQREDSTTVTVVTPVQVPTWGEDVTDWGLLLHYAYVSHGSAMGDVDGAVGDDLAFFPRNIEEEMDDFYLYPGWDVPWFDPTYWPQ